MKNKHSSGLKVKWRGGKPITIQELIFKSNFNTMMIHHRLRPKNEKPRPPFFPRIRIVDEENARKDAAEEEEHKQLEQEAAL